jgi:hypothetical protein
MGKTAQLSGQVFGRLTVTGEAGRSEDKMHVMWSCACACGNAGILVSTKDLRRGSKKSCGCLLQSILAVRNTTHGMAKSSTHGIWLAMRNRCNNPTVKAYPRYGGRGVSVCPRWATFENFLEDMGVRPEGLTLDRKDVNGNYEPGNCRWATYEEQNNNRRDNVFVSVEGVGTLTLERAARHLQLDSRLLKYHLKKGPYCGAQLQTNT